MRYTANSRDFHQQIHSGSWTLWRMQGIESCSAMCLVPTRTLPVASIDRDATRSNSMKATGPIEHPTSSTSWPATSVQPGRGAKSCKISRIMQDSVEFQRFLICKASCSKLVLVHEWRFFKWPAFWWGIVVEACAVSCTLWLHQAAEPDPGIQRTLRRSMRNV